MIDIAIAFVGLGWNRFSLRAELESRSIGNQQAFLAVVSTLAAVLPLFPLFPPLHQLTPVVLPGMARSRRFARSATRKSWSCSQRKNHWRRISAFSQEISAAATYSFFFTNNFIFRTHRLPFPKNTVVRLPSLIDRL